MSFIHCLKNTTQYIQTTFRRLLTWERTSCVYSEVFQSDRKSHFTEWFFFNFYFNQNWNVYTVYALKPTNTFHHILCGIHASHMCICWFYYINLNILQYRDIQHIIEHKSFWGKKKLYNVHFHACLSGTSRSVPIVMTARRSGNALVFVAIAVWMCLKVTLLRLKIPLRHSSLGGGGKKTLNFSSQY